MKIKTKDIKYAYVQLVFKEVGKTLGLSSDRRMTVNIIIDEMYQDKIVTLIKLRRHLGDHIPGIVNTMTKETLGISVEKLYKKIRAEKIITKDVMPRLAYNLEKIYLNELDKKIKTRT